ncbi:radical SAM protein [Candidatus Woesearchaeota archaeon]|nr:radical SAM protein [Candidatus Woesearchaeota archaeon]
MQKTPYYSWKSGELAEGCKLCVEGKKLVLFITGKCTNRCWYCPVNEAKFGKDVVYANEWKVENPDEPGELIKEAELTDAKGAGITGGDPLCNIDRTVKYIHLLKERFGKDFHIHLYTPLKLVTKETLRRLYDAGLDEIRFHPDLTNDKLWDRLDLANEFEWDIGIEIPAIPQYEEQTKKLIDFAVGKIKFLNLNELERSDTVAEHYKMDALGFKQKNNLSYGVEGSEEMALRMLEYAEKKGLRTHYCTARLKDAVQLQSRIKRRAENVAYPFDKKTEEGLLIRGVCYLPGLQPGIDYKKRMADANRDDALEKLRKLSKQVDCIVDEKKLRLLMSAEKTKHETKQLLRLGLIPAIVEEYPTEDGLEVEIEFLGQNA